MFISSTKLFIVGICLSLISSVNAAKINSSDSLPQTFKPFNLFSNMSAAAPHTNPTAIRLALSSLECAVAHGMSPANRLAIIDYSLPSTQPRLWVFDLITGTLLFEELVAHGRNSGENYTRSFSNLMGSLQSSIGLFRTKDTYLGSNGYSLRMVGLEAGFNDNAMARAIVMHGAEYVDSKFAMSLGRLGRSWGCPAVRAGIARKVIDAIKNEQFVFSYYPDDQWLKTSAFLHCQATSLLRGRG